MVPDPAPALARLSDDYFRCWLTADPFTATEFGVPGYDAEVPDPGRAAEQAHLAELERIATEAAALDPRALDPQERVTRSMLERLAADRRAELAARRKREAEEYARWRARQDALAEHDRKVRRFLLGFGAAVGTGLVAGIGVAGWLVWHAFAAAGVGLIAVPLALLATAGLVVGGHRCVTVVQHWH